MSARRPTHRARTAALAVLLLALAAAFAALALSLVAPARAEELLPPPEAGDGDYELERADSLADGAFETTYATTGTSTTAPRRAQRLRFRGGGTSGSLREGDDALAGGRLEAPLARGTLRVGRLAPRWGRGLVFGASAEPWSAAPADRGEAAAFRGRAGEGAAWEAGESVTLLTGRFARRSLWGARARAGPLGLGAASVRGLAQASAAFGPEEASAELAADGHGRWRAETAWREDAGALTLGVFVRAGSAGWRPLGEPRRAGPSRALAASAAHAGATRDVRALLAAWRFSPGVPGARASLEVHQRLVHHASVLFGFEERRGTLRDPQVVSGAAGATGMRQGAWCEWRGATPRGDLALRHEWWGARAFARAAVRRVSVASGDAALPGGARLSVTHAVWSARRGERTWLLESAEDRLVLRALSGAGTRTRCELTVPALGGRAKLAIAIAESGGKSAAPHWTAEWTRRARL